MVSNRALHLASNTSEEIASYKNTSNTYISHKDTSKTNINVCLSLFEQSYHLKHVDKSIISHKFYDKKFYLLSQCGSIRDSQERPRTNFIFIWITAEHLINTEYNKPGVY